MELCFILILVSNTKLDLVKKMVSNDSANGYQLTGISLSEIEANLISYNLLYLKVPLHHVASVDCTFFCIA